MIIEKWENAKTCRLIKHRTHDFYIIVSESANTSGENSVAEGSLQAMKAALRLFEGT